MPEMKSRHGHKYDHHAEETLRYNDAQEEEEFEEDESESVKKDDSVDDPNIKLFRIYTWIMMQPTSTLKLFPALCLNASADKVVDLNNKI